jgi:hypothetical protein
VGKPAFPNGKLKIADAKPNFATAFPKIADAKSGICIIGSLDASQSLGMKLVAKISHLLWAGMCSSFLIWFSVTDGLGAYSYKDAPYLLAIPGFSIAWLVFAVALMFERRWAFYGSFLLAVLSLFVTYYVAWAVIAIAAHEHSSFILEIIGAAAATIVVWLLLKSRHDLVRAQDNTA